MKRCPQNEPTPSCEMLRAFALGELHGDGSVELAAHLERCPSCARRVRVLMVLERCDRALYALSDAAVLVPVEDGRIAAAWQTVVSGLLELRQKLVISLRAHRDRLVRWADDVALMTRTPAVQWLAPESLQIVKEVPISRGDGQLTCSLQIFRDVQGVTRLGVSFGDRTGQEHGVLRVVLCHADAVKESRSARQVSDITFDTPLSPGDYVVQLRGEGPEHHIRISVD